MPWTKGHNKHFACKFCYFFTPTRDVFSIHLNKQHNYCLTCDVKIVGVMDAHLKLKHYICNACDSFVTIGALAMKKHMLNNHGSNDGRIRLTTPLIDEKGCCVICHLYVKVEAGLYVKDIVRHLDHFKCSSCFYCSTSYEDLGR